MLLHNSVSLPCGILLIDKVAHKIFPVPKKEEKSIPGHHLESDAIVLFISGLYLLEYD